MSGCPRRLDVRALGKSALFGSPREPPRESDSSVSPLRHLFYAGAEPPIQLVRQQSSARRCGAFQAIDLDRHNEQHLKTLYLAARHIEVMSRWRRDSTS